MTDIIDEAERMARIEQFLEQHNSDDPNAVRITDETQAQNLLRAHFLDSVDGIVDYWDRLPQKTPRERISGAIFSVFNHLDGGSIGVPSFDVISRQDAAFMHNDVKVIIPSGTHICDGELHSQFINREALLRNINEAAVGLAKD